MKGSQNPALKKQGYGVEGSELLIEGVPASKLAAAAGTPVYIYSETQLENNLLAFKDSFVSKMFDTRVLYASKAFNIVEMLKIVNRLGLGLDVVSAGELYTAYKAGFDMSRVVFHGNAKTKEELLMALDLNVGTVVLDHLQEAKLLAHLAKDYPQTRMNVILRVNPGVEAHTHAYIVTAHVDSKFGVLISDMDEIRTIAGVFDGTPIRFAGFHAHIGSQIFDQKAFEEEIRVMFSFIRDFESISGLRVDTLDLGGGFAAWYSEEDQPIDVRTVCEAILKSAAQNQVACGTSVKNLWIEPGRSIVGNAACTLYRIESIKHTPNKTYVFTDGGMNDNIRPALYDAAYSCDLANRMDEEKEEAVCVAGKCCESGDILVKEGKLPAAMPEDLLVIYTTGAYGYSMASHYNKLGVPPVLFVKDGKARMVVRRETLDDLIANEVNEEVIV